MQLGTWQECPMCKERGYSGMHQCKPVWEACDPADWKDAADREWETIRAADAEHAAEVYCAHRDPYAEYGTVSATRTVLVRPFGAHGQAPLRYEVHGELTPVYVAHLRPPVDTE